MNPNYIVPHYDSSFRERVQKRTDQKLSISFAHCASLIYFSSVNINVYLVGQNIWP